MRRSRIVAACAAVAVAAAGGAVYVGTRSSGSSAPRPAHVQPVVRTAPLPAVSGAPLPTRSGLRAALARLLRHPALGGTPAVVVADADTGAVLFQQRAGASLPPASTAKLLTAVAALDGLGADARLTTSVVRDADTLYLVGGGDMTLSRRARTGYPVASSIADLARRTAVQLSDHSAAVTLRYDASAWRGPASAPGWNDYFSSGDVSHLSPLEVDEGRVAVAHTERVGDPAAQAAAVFANLLRTSGVKVRPRIRAGIAPQTAQQVADVDSAPMSALVQRLLTTSDNDLAEAIGRSLAIADDRPATFAGAAGAITAHLRGLGVPVRGLRLYDASGLSHLDRVTPRVVLAALRVAQQAGPAMQSVVQGLPVAGLTGTLSDRFRVKATRPGAGEVRAKTGTLAGVSALAGQVVDADGRLLHFVLMSDLAASPSAAERALDRLAAALADCGCG